MAVKHYLDILSSFLEEKREGFHICESSLLKHFVLFYGVFRSLYLIKVPLYLGGRFLSASAFTRDFPISLPRLQAGLVGTEREEHR